jgi:excinuclease UvrABC helicase subunit UvrB
MNLIQKKNIDLLIDHFWKQGYLTISRKFGTYLPEPTKIGGHEVDIIAKFKNDYAIGIILSEDDIESYSISDKLTYLASRQTRWTNKKVVLFVGVPFQLFGKAKLIIQSLNEEVKKNIRLIQIIDPSINQKVIRKKQRTLFS